MSHFQPDVAANMSSMCKTTDGSTGGSFEADIVSVHAESQVEEVLKDLQRSSDPVAAIKGDPECDGCCAVRGMDNLEIDDRGFRWCKTCWDIAQANR